ncbi:MAG: zeta toxin family protein [Treponema sp.]|nr:zeta toxin family protein [Treponema sp.]
MSKPVVLVFAGPNGSGKSTITNSMPLFGVYVNADNLRREYALTDLQAAQQADALRNRLVQKKADFSFETVLSTNRNLLLLQKAKESGYEIQCIYVLTCNADINVARIRGRVCDGGHDVPEDKIRSRFVRALELLPQIINMCDKILIYDNSIMPTLVFKKDEGGTAYFPTDIWSIKQLKELLRYP